MSLRSKFKEWFPENAIKNITHLTVGNFFEYKAGFLYGVGGAYILGATGWGQLVFVMTVVRLSVLLFDLRAGNPTTKLVRERLEGDSSLQIREIIAGIIYIQGSVLTLFFLLFMGFLLMLAPQYGIIASWQTALGYFALSEVLYVFRNWFSSLLVGYEKFTWKSLQNVWTSIWRDYVVLLFMYFGGVEGACLGFLVAELVIACSLFTLGVNIWGFSVLSELMVPNELIRKTYLHRMIYRNLRSNYVSYVLKGTFSRLSRVFLGGMAGVRSLGIYDIAMKFKKILTFFTQPVQKYLFPRFISKWKQENKKEFYYTFRKYFYQLGPVYVLLTILVVFLSPWLVPIFYSRDFMDSIPVLFVILPAFAVQKLFGIFYKMTFVISRQRALVFKGLIEVLVALPIAYLLINLYGHMGAAWALVVRIGLNVGYQSFFFYQNFDWKWIVPR